MPLHLAAVAVRPLPLVLLRYPALVEIEVDPHAGRVVAERVIREETPEAVRLLPEHLSLRIGDPLRVRALEVLEGRVPRNLRRIR